MLYHALPSVSPIEMIQMFPVFHGANGNKYTMKNPLLNYRIYTLLILPLPWYYHITKRPTTGPRFPLHIPAPAGSMAIPVQVRFLCR